MPMLSSLSCSSARDPGLWGGVTVTVGLPSSTYPVYKLPRVYDQRFVFYVILDPVEIIRIIHPIHFSLPHLQRHASASHFPCRPVSGLGSLPRVTGCMCLFGRLKFSLSFAPWFLLHSLPPHQPGFVPVFSPTHRVSAPSALLQAPDVSLFSLHTTWWLEHWFQCKVRAAPSHCSLEKNKQASLALLLSRKKEWQEVMLNAVNALYSGAEPGLGLHCE